MAKSNPFGETLALAESCFTQQDPRLVDTLRQIGSAKWMARFADRWKADGRPWARQQILDYLNQPLDTPGHQPLVKRLFKAAEQANDDELMGAFLAAFDTLVRKVRHTRYRYDWQTRQSWQEEILTAPRNKLPTESIYIAGGRKRPAGRLFSVTTRIYLRRRGWRYFRRLARQRPADYPAAVAHALRRYTDEQLSAAEHVLESWGLMQACFREHDALAFGARYVTLKEGRSFSELTPAPRFLPLWQTAEALPVLLQLAGQARARLVRLWAMTMIRNEHRARLAELPVAAIMSLLAHADEEVQQFGSELLEQSPATAHLPLEDWQKLLQIENLTVVAVVCDLMRQHVTVDRVPLATSISMACATQAPVARLGFEYVQQQFAEHKTATLAPSTHRDMIAQLGQLAQAKCALMAGKITTWVLSIVGAAGQYDRDAVTAFFDSLLVEARTAAWDWLVGGSAAMNDPVLFTRLLETPFDDLRLALIDELQRKATLPGVNSADLSPVWATVLLGVHRGGRQKNKATGQLADAMIRRPELTPELLPVLAVAVRSIRPPEMQAGLAAISRLLEHCPEVTPLVTRQLPELTLASAEQPAP